MKLSPYLNFNGQCAAAFDVYAKCFGGTITFMQTFGESPMKDQVPADWHDKIMHTTLTIGDTALAGADAPPAHYAQPQGIQVSISIGDPAEGERIFKALAENGTITVPFEKTFWSSGFGMVVDRFGIPWMVNCEEAASPAAV
jgi:PhnB protein